MWVIVKLQIENPDLETGRGFFFLVNTCHLSTGPARVRRGFIARLFACRSGSHIPCICSPSPVRLSITAESEMRCRLFSEGKSAIGFPWLIIRAAFEESQPRWIPNSSRQGAG